MERRFNFANLVITSDIFLSFFCLDAKETIHDSYRDKDNPIAPHVCPCQRSCNTQIYTENPAFRN